MRLIPETAPPQVDVAAGQQIGGNPGSQRLVGLVIPVPEPGPVGRVKIGHGTRQPSSWSAAWARDTIPASSTTHSGRAWPAATAGLSAGSRPTT